jgi:hypothetical protein
MQDGRRKKTKAGRAARGAALGAALAAVTAGVVAGPAAAAPSSATAPGTIRTTAATPAFVARFITKTTQPKADTAWDYCLIVVEPKKVMPLEAAVLQRLFDDAGNPIGEVGKTTMFGAWCQAIKLPASIKGQPITLETKVTVGGREVRLRTPIRVR